MSLQNGSDLHCIASVTDPYGSNGTPQGSVKSGKHSEPNTLVEKLWVWELQFLPASCFNSCPSVTQCLKGRHTSSIVSVTQTCTGGRGGGTALHTNTEHTKHSFAHIVYTLFIIFILMFELWNSLFSIQTLKITLHTIHIGQLLYLIISFILENQCWMR